MSEESDSKSKRTLKPPLETETITDQSQQPKKRRLKSGWSSADPSPTKGLSTTESLNANVDQNKNNSLVKQLPPSPIAPSLAIPASLDSPLTSSATALAYQKRFLCRIYVGSLDYYLTVEEIKRIFEAFGTIVTIDMPREGDRSKGFCFIEYITPESAEIALSSMKGFVLKGRNIKVGRPSASGLPLPNLISPTTNLPFNSGPPASGSHTLSPTQAGALAAISMLNPKPVPDSKNLEAKVSECISTSPFDPSINLQSSQLSQNLEPFNLDPLNPLASRIYVGNIPLDLTHTDLEKIFAVFGTVLYCHLLPHTELPGTHRGYGFVDFTSPAEAKLAIDTMNGFQIADKFLKVNYAATVKQPTPSSLTTSNNNNLSSPSSVNFSTSTPPILTSTIGTNSFHPGLTNLPTSPGTSNSQALSPHLPYCLNITSTHNSTNIPVTPKQHIPNVGDISPLRSLSQINNSHTYLLNNSHAPTPTSHITSSKPLSTPDLKQSFKTIRLSNMVNPNEIDDDLKIEIRSECQNYGKVDDIDVKIINNSVEVFVTFSTDAEALRALPNFNGRWFAGKQIICKLAL